MVEAMLSILVFSSLLRTGDVGVAAVHFVGLFQSVEAVSSLYLVVMLFSLSDHPIIQKQLLYVTQLNELINR